MPTFASTKVQVERGMKVPTGVLVFCKYAGFISCISYMLRLSYLLLMLQRRWYG